MPEGKHLYEFGPFRLDPSERSLLRDGKAVPLTPKAFELLVLLVENRGHLLKKDELIERVWPNTFVEEANLTQNVSALRKALDDKNGGAQYIETVPKGGYRFIALMESGGEANAIDGAQVISAKEFYADPRHESLVRSKILPYSVVVAVVVLMAIAAFVVYKKSQSPAISQLRALTRLTFDPGLQFGATWSPDSRFIAYSSDRAGKFDIWVRQVSGGDPVQVTKGPGHNWQPDWSPDGKYIAYRSESGEGGLFIVPALGGVGLERKVASFGYYPHWSPDGSQILFQTNQFSEMNQFDVVSLDGSPPREVLTEFLAKHWLSTKSAAWHPDGKRISIWVFGNGPVPTFWTVPVAGGGGVKSEIDPQLLRQLGDVSVSLNDELWRDFKFSWMPSGKAIYFERTFRGARNLWKMTVDPKTLRALAIERLTTGPGPDTELALSADGKKLAFTMESQHVQAWLIPFDATRGWVTGASQAVTSPGMEAWHTRLSRDGKKLAFAALRAGRWELWEKSLVGGRETPVAADDYVRYFPQWSPDGTRLAYGRIKSIGPGQNRLFVWSVDSRDEEPLTAPSDLWLVARDWSSDGKQLLVEQESGDTHKIEVSLMSAAAVPQSEPAARKIISNPEYDLYQPTFSPDGRWIVFQATRSQPTRAESTLYVTPATGGPWIRITGGKHWDDKPRWAPDGKTIYFVSGRGGFFNVWGIRFDPAQGRKVGDAFRVTAFENPGLMVPKYIRCVELSLTQDKFVLTMEERSGGIWALDNVEQ